MKSRTVKNEKGKREQMTHMRYYYYLIKVCVEKKFCVRVLRTHISLKPAPQNIIIMSAFKSPSSQRVKPTDDAILRRSSRLHLKRIVPATHHICYHDPLLSEELVNVMSKLQEFQLSMGNRGSPLQMELTDKQLKVTSCGHSCILEAGKSGAQKFETNGTLYTKNRPDWLYGIVYGLTAEMFSEPFEYETNAHGDTGGPREVGAPIKRVDAQAYFLFYAYNLEDFLGIDSSDKY